MKNVCSMFTLAKQAVMVLLTVVFLFPLPVRAEVKAGSFELSPFVGYNVFENRQNLKDGTVYGGRIGYNFSRYFALEGTIESIHSRVDDQSRIGTDGVYGLPADVSMNKVDLTSYHLDALYHFSPERKFSPYVVGGVGATHYSPEISNQDMTTLDLGIGADYWMAKNFALRFDVRDHLVTEVFQDSFQNVNATVGLVFAFGGKSKAVPTAVVSYQPIPDTTAPTVDVTVPAQGATGVAVNCQLTATFSKAMDPATLTTATVQVTGAGATSIAGVVTYSGTTVTFTPTSLLAGNTACTATITTGAKDLAGNALASNYGWTFTTGATPDTTAPTVGVTVPAQGATGVPVNSQLTATFSKAMDPVTLTTATVLVTGADATPIAGVVTYSGTTATFTPTSLLANDTACTATITTGAKDLAGNALASNYSWTFNSEAKAPEKVVILVSDVPAPKVEEQVKKLATDPKITEKIVILAFDDVYFNFDKSTLTEKAQTILKRCVRMLKKNPKIHLRIAGYTSASGTDAYDQKLSERRATAVKDYLVHAGVIASDRLSAIGYGKTTPAEYEAAPSSLYSAAAKANMRVVFEVIVK